jgi:hypothetical protein
MTAAGRALRGLTSYAGADESPDRQAIPGPYGTRRGDGDGDGDRRRLVAFLDQRSADR